jgi:lipopolysaccharide transport system ATP-binding protein
VKDLCRTAIVLNQGQVAFQGPVVEGIALYSQNLLAEPWDEGDGGTGWHQVRIDGRANGFASSVESGQGFRAGGVLDLGEDFASARFFCIIHDAVGDLVVHHRVYAHNVFAQPLDAGRYRVEVALPGLWLAPGVYTLQFKFMGQARSGADVKQVSERVVLDVTGEAEAIDSARLAPPARWEVTPAAVAERVTSLV